MTRAGRAQLEQVLKRLQEFQASLRPLLTGSAAPDEVAGPLRLLFGWLAKERELAKVQSSKAKIWTG